MTLYEYLSKHPRKKLEFAIKLGISESSLYKYINKKREPRLAVAIKIHQLTKGKVKYQDLVLDRQGYDNIEDDADLL